MKIYTTLPAFPPVNNQSMSLSHTLTPTRLPLTITRLSTNVFFQDQEKSLPFSHTGPLPATSTSPLPLEKVKY